jgi:hypothetical protein
MSETKLNQVNVYLYFSDISRDANIETCPKCNDCLSVNWHDGSPYVHCVDGCDLTARDFEENTH